MSSTEISTNSKHPFTFFDMYGPYRESVIEKHRFYVDQGKSKLLSQFGNMENEADEAAERWLADRSQFFNPERDDPVSYEENAYHEGVWHYQLLSELLDQTRLSIVAGMYHSWDKELRRWLLKEIHQWHRGPNVDEKIWKATFDEISEFLISVGLCQGTASFLQKLSACRYVVNVYKHGEGISLQRLKSKHPEYLRTYSMGEEKPDMNWIDHTHLLVSDVQLDDFSAAITEFWSAIPEQIRCQKIQVPAWFESAAKKDRAIS